MRKRLLYGVLGLIVVFGVIQLIPVEQHYPAVESAMPAPVEVQNLLRRACYDCHSNETVWPWYSRVAPLSWLVTHDVNEGRQAVNFSIWDRYSPAEQSKKLKESRKEIADREMPLWIYTIIHPEARLWPQDLVLLQQWLLASARE